MDIYVKPCKKISVYKIGRIKLKDVAEIYAKPQVKEKCGELIVYDLKKGASRHNVISIMNIISAISKIFPEATVSNVGESDTVIDFIPNKGKENKLINFIKVAVISVILFAGASTAIMSFHSDAQLKITFEKYYHIFFNERVESPAIICIPYSIGLTLGIIVFFNHIFGKDLSDDPTPIQVEMSLYEKDLEDNIIQTNSRKEQ